jgi:hypothetical protein
MRLLKLPKAQRNPEPQPFRRLSALIARVSSPRAPDNWRGLPFPGHDRPRDEEPPVDRTRELHQRVVHVDDLVEPRAKQILLTALASLPWSTVSQDEKDPWKFIAPRNLTPRRQYLVGFFVYCGVLLLIYLALSLVGPDKILQIAKSSGVSTPELDAALKDFSTFPIVVAFVIIGLNPSLHLPKSLDFEIFIRRLAHRIAYIPKNMDLIFNYMRFSDFDWPQVKIDDAWNAIGLRRPLLDAPDCGSIRSLLDRTVPLYVKALNLAKDGEIENGREVMEDLRVDLCGHHVSMRAKAPMAGYSGHCRLLTTHAQR